MEASSSGSCQELAASGAQKEEGEAQRHSMTGLSPSGWSDDEGLNSGSTEPELSAMPEDDAEGRPSRHLWLGNIPLRPNKAAMEVLFR